MSKMKVGELMKEIDSGVVKDINIKVTNNGSLIEDICDKIIKENTEDLDTFMDKITAVLNDSDNPSLSPDEMDQALLRLTTLLYYTSSKAEGVGIKSDLASSVRKEVYNNAFINMEGTINEKMAKADDESLGEKIVEIAYTRAYNKIRNKVQIGLEMLAALKKIMSRRLESRVEE